MNYLEVIIKMKLKDLTQAELEAMSYDDIAEMILTETNRQMKINELFKEVCKLINLSDDEFVDKLPAFFDVLSTDHRFIIWKKRKMIIKTSILMRKMKLMISLTMMN